MIVRAVTADNDWCYGKGKNDYKKDRSAVAQNIKTRLQSFLGDCPFATNAGIDWWNILGTKNIVGAKLAISSIILNTTDVTGILELSFNLDNNRAFTISYRVQTIYGVVDEAYQYDVAA